MSATNFQMVQEKHTHTNPDKGFKGVHCIKYCNFSEGMKLLKIETWTTRVTYLGLALTKS